MVKGLAIWNNDTCIVLGVDIGTTRSAIAFSHLHKGSVASVQRVSHWPGSRQGDVKIPTQIYYDSKGEPVRIGAETLETAREGWHLAKHFKLHLHPDTMKRKHNLAIEALPNGVTLMKIYVDFMCYLLKHTKTFFEEHVSQGKSVWEQYFPSMKVVIAHPNGWNVNEQDFLRRAAVTAGYVTSRNASSQIQFVSEAEASVHFCILHMNKYSAMKPGVAFVVCDAGGSTVDMTVYGVKFKAPRLELEEKGASDCIQAGSIFVDQKAENYLRQFLQSTDLHEGTINKYVAKGMQEFERTVKKAFSGDEGQTITIAGHYNNPSPAMKRGRIQLESNIIESFFKASVDEIISCMTKQMSGLNIKGIFVVGGFGQNPYLRTTLKRRFEPIEIFSVNDEDAKMVADGAVVWFVMTSVTSRAARFSYGTQICELHDSSNRAHDGREVFLFPNGYPYVSGQWSEIAPRGAVIHANAAVRQSYSRKYKTSRPNLSDHCGSIYAFTLPGHSSGWLRNINGDLNPGFKEICIVRANLNGLQGQLKQKRGLNGPYWKLSYVIGIRFGRTELEAFIEWDEEGKTCISEAAVIPNSLK
jgi:molecular chaperone DnaK (HSP70)